MKLDFYAVDGNGGRIPLVLEEKERELTATLPLKCFENAESIRIECDAFRVRAPQKGYYLIPDCIDTRAGFLTYFTEREDCELVTKAAKLTARFYAVGLSEATYIVCAESDYTVSVGAFCHSGVYGIYLDISFETQPAVGDVVLNILRLDAGSDYNCVAKAIREYRLAKGEIVPLKQKCRQRPQLEYYRKYPLIRIRMGWKPAPPTVLTQTIENEPPMHVACSFARVRDIADELKRQGVEGATLSLVGWNQKGHDGRWPQAFPVEEALGGEEELRKTVKYANSLGYAVTCHTNCLDSYEIADIFDRESLVVKRNGEVLQHGSWSGGRTFHICPVCQLKLAEGLLPRVRELGFDGVHYVDVLSTAYPDACFSKEHFCSTGEGIERMKAIMRLSRELFGGFSSEGAMAFSLGELDFSLYDRFEEFTALPPEEPLADAYIPFIELAYHGVLLYNPCSQTVNYPLKSGDEAATVALLGGLPTFYFYSRFCGEGRGNWMGESDLTCDSDDELRESVSKIKTAWEEYRKYADRQLVYISSYESFGNGLAAVTYEDGSTVVANYSDGTLEYKGNAVPPHGYRYL